MFAGDLLGGLAALGALGQGGYQEIFRCYSMAMCGRMELDAGGKSACAASGLCGGRGLDSRAVTLSGGVVVHRTLQLCGGARMLGLPCASSPQAALPPLPTVLLPPSALTRLSEWFIASAHGRGTFE